MEALINLKIHGCTLQEYFNCTSPAFDLNKERSHNRKLVFEECTPLPSETWTFTIFQRPDGEIETREEFNNPAMDWDYLYANSEELYQRITSF